MVAAVLILAASMPAPLCAADSSLKEEIRTWTTFDDKVMTASFVKSDGKTVTLDRRNGSEPVVIPIARLKFEDQVFVRWHGSLDDRPGIDDDGRKILAGQSRCSSVRGDKEGRPQLFDEELFLPVRTRHQ